MLQYTYYVWNRSLSLKHLLNHRAGKYEYFIYLNSNIKFNVSIGRDEWNQRCKIHRNVIFSEAIPVNYAHVEIYSCTFVPHLVLLYPWLYELAT